MSSIRWPEEETEQVTLPILCLYLVLTDGRGKGRVRISCMNEATEEEVFSSQERRLSFEGKDPSELYRVVVRLSECVFTQRGVYAVRFLFEEDEIEHRILHVR
jgi:hypothetical protein